MTGMERGLEGEVPEVSDAEGFGEGSSGQEAAGSGAHRARMLRAQAQIAWSRVQRSVPRSGPPDLSIDGLMDTAARLPNEGYITGVAASLVTSAWLYALGRKRASAYVGVIPSLVFGLGLYARHLRLKHQ